MQERPFSYHLRADFSPADCLISGRRENLIDLGAQDIPGYGRVYIDVITFAELAAAMGFVDEAQHKHTVTTLETEVARLRNEKVSEQKHFAAAIASLAGKLEAASDTPNREALKEFQDGFTSLVDGLTDRLFRPGDGVPDLPVPTDEPSAVVSDIGAVGSGKRAVPRRGKAKPGAAAVEPESAGRSSDVDAGGDPEVTPAGTPVGGPELHESAERDESADGDAEPDLEGFFDTTGD